MVTLFNSKTEDNTPKPYSKKQDIDTRIPPKAKPVFNQISVNGIAIEEADILAEAQNHPAENPGEALTAAARALVIRELLLQEAKRLNLYSDDLISDQRSDTPQDIAISKLMDQEISVPNATIEDCQRFYSNNTARFLSDMIVEARHILISADPKVQADREGAKTIATEIIRNLELSPSRFDELAKEYSDCPSSMHGGNLGQLTTGSTVPEFEQALKIAEGAGLIKNPVETRYGFHVVDIIRKIPGTPLPFEAVKDRVSAWLEASSWSRAVSQYILILAGNAKIEGIEVLPSEGPLVQ
ncbi:peptidylprolyl isomerase [Bartonella sp. HY329]|uniref:peptidylprolyl isomerase n=1 Tax=unclassified Bartonella TaxID=2645622 RepID=UPI0021C775FD|nr:MULTISPECIES: peptidylprolyl isomerase [unclassified Bartonella]UXM93915.1 peptidylprolyl isomerase [Bartonella sp. HY329]UXN08236.1 peptidylprolyl isomerase [Bartonella sp. HY328]